MTKHPCKQLKYLRFEKMYDPQLSDAENASWMKTSTSVVNKWRRATKKEHVVKRKLKFDTNKFLELYHLKWSDNKIADELGVSQYCITTYRNKQGLLPNYGNGRQSKQWSEVHA